MSEIEKQEAKGRKRNVQINIRISEAEAEQLRKKRITELGEKDIVSEIQRQCSKGVPEIPPGRSRS